MSPSRKRIRKIIATVLINENITGLSTNGIITAFCSKPPEFKPICVEIMSKIDKMIRPKKIHFRFSSKPL